MVKGVQKEGYQLVDADATRQKSSEEAGTLSYASNVVQGTRFG